MKKIRLLFSFILIFSVATFGAILFTKDIHNAQGANIIYLNDKSLTLEVDHYKTLRIKGTTSSATWRSSSSWVASVSSSGKVFAKAPGTSTITASVDGRKLTCKVTVLFLNKKTLTLIPDQTSTLTVTGTNSEIIWNSSNNSVATVSNSGQITAVAPGAATITASVDGIELSSKITVIDINLKNVVLVHGFRIGFIKTLKINGTSSNITWTSNNKSVATVSSSGKVTAQGPGTATITASVDGKAFTSQVKVLEMSVNAFTLKKGETKTLDVLGTNNDITWASYKKSVATVSNDGTVTAQSTGEATIVGYVDGRIVRSRVTVTE